MFAYIFMEKLFPMSSTKFFPKVMKNLNEKVMKLNYTLSWKTFLDHRTAGPQLSFGALKQYVVKKRELRQWENGSNSLKTCTKSCNRRTVKELVVANWKERCAGFTNVPVSWATNYFYLYFFLRCWQNKFKYYFYCGYRAARWKETICSIPAPL